ncbi:hypothetical protein MPTK1_3g04020 [Marchantia polymorpha subsp. ruderalis]|uniref:Uncharacterized protein n=2 Tax=Marchantia polymorpha TaxID=3197 RepID=A0AAF6AX88_MARPO|nr:hypothetical protein MARPO_0022s0129 [Marchantia polymorpha]BBN04372.1 hypothetical protein Mp_3g04020 [Marchantia polymorpha subsp. ruderalis]|eukprot:PTQ44032.1 hypothetical protein MARPO_0022s0129 [Marchantia polymorpha]
MLTSRIQMRPCESGSASGTLYTRILAVCCSITYFTGTNQSTARSVRPCSLGERVLVIKYAGHEQCSQILFRSTLYTTVLVLQYRFAHTVSIQLVSASHGD